MKPKFESYYENQVPKGLRRFELKVLGYGNSYYIERIAELEAVLARKPYRLQIDLVDEGEIPADMALLIRSILTQRSPKTRIVTNFDSYPVGRAVQAAVCRTAEAGAIPARDSISWPSFQSIENLDIFNSRSRGNCG